MGLGSSCVGRDFRIISNTSSVGTLESRLENSSSSFLHGDLTVEILEVKGFKADSEKGTAARWALMPTRVPQVKYYFVATYLGTTKLCCTRFAKADSTSPTVVRWKETHSVPVCHNAKQIVFQINGTSDDELNQKQSPNVQVLVASTTIPVEDVLKYNSVGGWFRLKQEVPSDPGTHPDSLGAGPRQVHANGTHVADYHQLANKNHNNNNNNSNQCSVRICLRYTPKNLMVSRHRFGREFLRGYFPMRTDNRMVLYQNADTPMTEVFDGVTFPNGLQYRPPRAWIDLTNALIRAEKFIYICGRSLDTNVSLVRLSKEYQEATNLGQLLLRKSEEGVVVLILLWVAPNARPVSNGPAGGGPARNSGQMPPHLLSSSNSSEETVRFFSGTKVKVAAVPNPACQYTHNQSTVVMDEPIEILTDTGSGSPWLPMRVPGFMMSSKSQVVAFVGGLDLTRGRYDSHEHPLFTSLIIGEDELDPADNQVAPHGDDFYNGSFSGETGPRLGPREPWHECSVRIEGSSALDVKRNFEERWVRLGSGAGVGVCRPEVRQVSPAIKSAGTLPATIYGYLDLYEAKAKDEFVFRPQEDEEEDVWNVQVFRSITSASCRFDPDQNHFLISLGSPQDPADDGAGSGSATGLMAEDSIYRCLVQQIRSARNFIYIETASFVGGSYSWSGKGHQPETATRVDDDIDDEADGASDNVVPREIAERIIEKIAAGENFKVYLVIPMWPEGGGHPESAASQQVLHCQYRTMDMMYRRIAKALREMKLPYYPSDYLNFFCLGKVEAPLPDHVDAQLDVPEPGSRAATLRRTRRMPIRVNTNLAIFDDEYILLGGGGLNQKSLDGGRDTELAIGGYQPYFEVGCDDVQDNIPMGDIHTFRMALWASHFGQANPEFLNPKSRECLQTVYEIALFYWEVYTAEDPIDSNVHIMPYPINVSLDGEVTPLETPWDCFPDTSASVLGSLSGAEADVVIPLEMTC